MIRFFSVDVLTQSEILDTKSHVKQHMYTSSVYFQCFILFLEKWVKFDNKKIACVLYVLCVENWNDIAYILMNHSISKNYCMCQNLIISIGISSYVIKTNISLITRQPGSITAFFIRKRHHEAR